jgi:alkaline phosphatase D
MIHRWTYHRSTPQLRPMLATIPQYATWDDHDYGPNDAGREFWQRDLAREIFTLFWANPSVGFPGSDGISTYFAWGDVHFYLLDNRSFRTIPQLNDTARFGYQAQQLGKAQIDWLIELMKFNRAQSVSSYPSSFHVIGTGSQVLSPHARDSLLSYPQEWQYLFDRLIAEDLHNVIFITGDVHYGEVNRMVLRPDGTRVDGQPAEEDFVFWEVTSSSLTAGSWAGAPAERSPNRLDIFPGEMDRVGQRNFATLSFEGPLTARRAVIRYFDSNGLLLNQDPDAPEGTPTAASIIHSRNLNLDPRLMRAKP